ncbi:methyltransferase domain-containing protein [Sphaerisporangium album]|uniref:Methyltransferase domain-containing protein n=1 Tax=Sphaerisporangium album TaxID=509200 RepID=A0A367FPT9_9ACTN|nr:methyltransferase domain-containing protein [Sphaerisporangium album]RCG31700.1 methyltransferase domain-containing protein [Sphaerisporangium album]
MLARATRGIEPLLADEIRPIGVVTHVRHREVWFRVREPGPHVLRLRTADDVFVLAAVADGVGPSKACLPRLAAAVRATDLEELRDLRGRCGGGPEVTGVDVSASFLGRRAYTRFDVEDAVGAEVARALGVRYHPRRGGGVPPAGTMSWRVTVEGERATLAVRIAARPLHRRPYKQASVPGTLHPPVAAAMARLALLDGARTVLDPCCGAGTLLVEASAIAARARLVGLDRDPDAVRAAARNGSPGIAWAVADAGRLPLPGASVERVLVNPPWRRQVAASGTLLRGDRPLWRELGRVLAPGGRVVALVHEPGARPRLADLAAEAGLTVRRTIEVSLSGAHPLIAVLTPSP